MSLETWQAEFMPVPADDTSAQASESAAALHSWWKWYGMMHENLKKHSVTHDEMAHLQRGESCALCIRHTVSTGVDCVGCSLGKLQQGPCNASGPWGRAKYDGKAGQLVNLLGAAYRQARESEQGL